MARRTFGARTRFVRTPGTKLWIGIDLSTTAVAAGASVLFGLFDAAALALRPFTILRTRAAFHAESDQLAASETPHGAMGMIVVSDQAAAAGVASIPAPLANSDAPFFVWEPWIASVSLATAVGYSDPSGVNITIDSKAMRKVNNNEDMAVVVQNVADGGIGANVTMVGRMLVNLH